MTQAVPLCVDLDGTLIHSDLLLESFLLMIKRNPLYLLLFPLWLLRGKAHLKAEIAKRVTLNGAALPYNQSFLTWLNTQRKAGRSLWLCTASDARMAEVVASHLGIFDGVLASDGHTNLSGHNKAHQLVERFGAKGFDYCGNHRVDLPIWAQSREAIVVNAPASLAQLAEQVATVSHTVPSQQLSIKIVAKALRVHQWAKNALVFVPLAAAHKLTEAGALVDSLLAFIAFSLCASSVYLLNDMLDLEADRQHHNKCERPFAAGRLSLLFGLLAAPALLLGALLLAAMLPAKFLVVLILYYLATLAYSFGIKKVVMVDVLALAGLYTVRIVAGAAATTIPLSFWLLIFAIFIFLSLAIVKRYAELYAMQEQGKLSAKGRGYRVDDLSILQSLGTSAGYLSILVLGLYLNSPEVSQMYHQPKFAWALVPIMLYWISRIWMQTHRGQMHDDPLVYALKDRVSLLTGFAAAVLLWFAV